MAHNRKVMSHFCLGSTKSEWIIAFEINFNFLRFETIERRACREQQALFF